METNNRGLPKRAASKRAAKYLADVVNPEQARIKRIIEQQDLEKESRNAQNQAFENGEENGVEVVLNETPKSVETTPEMGGKRGEKLDAAINIVIKSKTRPGVRISKNYF